MAKNNTTKYLLIGGALYAAFYLFRSGSQIKGIGKVKLSKEEQLDRALQAGVKFNVDFHTLPFSQIYELLEIAQEAGYRKSKSYPASKGHAYFHYLQKEYNKLYK